MGVAMRGDGENSGGSSRWSGFDEGDEISGSGSVELRDGSIKIALLSGNGDDAVITARRQ
jgi:hypothetical protein